MDEIILMPNINQENIAPKEVQKVHLLQLLVYLLNQLILNSCSVSGIIRARC